MLPIKLFFRGVEAVKLAAFKLLQLKLRPDWSHTAIHRHTKCTWLYTVSHKLLIII